jgi:ketosteroid isomerase-like protein
MNPTDEHLRRFLVRYGEALSAGDLKSISGYYAVPSLVLSDTGSVPIAAREEIEAAFEGAAERYRAQGLVLRPRVVFAWTASGFPNTATRWVFD